MCPFSNNHKTKQGTTLYTLQYVLLRQLSTRFLQYYVVDFSSHLEIDLQEAVSRFLNVPGKSGRQSGAVSQFLNVLCARNSDVSIDWFL